MLYKIKPLEWKNRSDDIIAPDLHELHESRTSISRFSVEKWISGNWAYSYCFDEYYDDGSGMCKDPEDGKAKCEKIWTERLKKCLIEKEA